jgi:hypothetical protein
MASPAILPRKEAEMGACGPDRTWTIAVGPLGKNPSPEAARNPSSFGLHLSVSQRGPVWLKSGKSPRITYIVTS